MKVLVTGVAGFIGSQTARALLARGDHVIGIDNLNDYYDVNLKLARLDLLKGRNNFHFIKADLGERGEIEAAFAEHRPERVINLAAQVGVRYALQNCPSSDVLRLVRRFVKGGSGSSGLEFKRPATDAASAG